MSLRVRSPFHLTTGGKQRTTIAMPIDPMNPPIADRGVGIGELIPYSSTTHLGLRFKRSRAIEEFGAHTKFSLRFVHRGARIQNSELRNSVHHPLRVTLVSRTGVCRQHG